MPDAALSQDTIICEAVEIADAAERSAYLDRACGSNAALRREVGSLVDAHFRAGDEFLQSPACDLAKTDSFHLDEDTLDLGAAVGPYKLRELVGQGGMGLVYVAEQSEPIRRKVALKVIKPGMDSRQVLARFEAERQSLALMDHPNIARVLDAGTTDQGRPYFVMELVRGTPINEFCDAQKLTVRQRLELFLQVCRAVQHAHQKGVIHRDLKPSNVLVAVHDVAPVAKVIDFGIAKAVGQQLTDKTVYTELAQFLGTPLYMSPEQAGQSSLDVDTRTDVYSLGVLLYELLTGTTPVSPESIRAAGPDELRRLIREVEPARPSVRLSTLQAAAQTTVADCRGADPRRLACHVRGELDWVVMKCLEKDRERRYESAGALAADVQRYMNEESVLARPPSLAYRVRKFVRRNRVAFFTMGLVASVLVAGTVISTWLAVEANEARKLADNRADKEAQAHREAGRQRVRADTNFQKALAAVDSMLTRVGDDSLRDMPHMDSVRRKLYEDALDFYRSFLAERSGDPALRYETCRILARVGTICCDLGRPNEGKAAIKEAISILRVLLAEEPANDAYRVDLAELHNELAWRLELPLSEKERLHRESGEILAPLADRPKTAAVRGKRLRSYLANSLRSRAAVLLASGRWAEAETFLTAAIGHCEDDPGWGRDVLASSYHHLSELHQNRAQWTDAIAAIKRTIAIRQTVVNADPTPHHRWELAVDWEKLGLYLHGRGQMAEAVSALRNATDISDRLISEYPAVAHYKQTAASARIAGIHALMRLNLYPEVLDYLAAGSPQPRSQLVTQLLREYLTRQEDKPLAVLDEVLRQYPMSQEAYEARADLYANRGEFEKAIADYDAAERIRPLKWWYHKRRAYARFCVGQFDKALADIREAITLQPLDISALSWIRPVAILRCPDDAFRSAYLNLAEDHFRKRPWDSSEVRYPATVANDFAWQLATFPDAARQEPRRAVTFARLAVGLVPGDVTNRRTLGVALYRAGDWKQAVAELSQIEGMHFDGITGYFLAMARRQLGEKDEARRLYDRAVAWEKKNRPKDEELRRFRAEAAKLLGILALPPRPKNRP